MLFSSLPPRKIPGYAPPGSAPVFDHSTIDRRLARSQAARTQGRFSSFQGVVTNDMNDSSYVGRSVMFALTVPLTSAFLSAKYLVSAGGLDLDQFVHRNVLQSEVPHLFHVIGVDAHRFQLDQLVHRDIFIAHRAQLLDVILVYAHSLQLDQLSQ